MKRWKKWLSAGLAVCMLTSTMSAALIAGAANTKSNLTDAQAAVNALVADRTSINVPAPVVPEDKNDPTYEKKKEALEKYNAKLALYETAIDAYKPLDELEKDALDVLSALSFFRTVIEHEAFLIKDAFDSKLPPDAPSKDKMGTVEARIQAQAKMDSIIGGQTARDEALAINDLLAKPYKDELKLSKTSDFKNADAVKALEKLKKAYKDASPLVRKYFDGTSTMFFSFSSNSLGTGFRTLLDIISAYHEQMTPNGLPIPANPSKKPSVKDFAGGATDPEYIAALAKWLPEKEAKVKYDCDKFTYTGDMNLKAADEIALLAPEFKEATTVMRQLRAAYKTFIEQKTTDAARDAMSAFGALDTYSQILSKTSVSAYSYYWLNDKKDDYSYNNLSFSQLYGKCEETGGMALVNEFVAYIDSVDLAKVTNDTIVEAKKRYNSVPSALRTAIPEATRTKYDAILAKYTPVGPNAPSTDKLEKELAAFKATNPTYPAGASKEEVSELLTILEGLLPSLVGSAGGLQGMLEQGVYTNAALSQVLTLYNTIEKANLMVDAMGIQLNLSQILGGITRPKDVAGYLAEDKFAGAKAKLNASVAADGSSKTADYLNISFANGDWGFQDGDRDGFTNALLAAIRPLGNLLLNGWGPIGQILLLANTTADNGDYVYGAYEQLIPLLEGMGLKNVLSSEEYSKRYYEAAKVSYGAQLDSMFLPIVTPVLDLVEELAAAPIDTALSLLPRLAKVVNDGTLTTSINNFAHTSSLLSGMNVDLSGDALNTMLSGILSGIALDETTTLNIKLSPIDWAALAGCGDVALADSVSASNAYRVALEPDTADAFLIGFRYVFDNLLGNTENYNQLVAALKKLMPDSADTITNLLVAFKGAGADQTLGMLVEMLVPEPDPVDPVDPVDPSKPGEDIPQTGDAALTIMGTTAMIGMAGYFFSRKKHA